MRDKEALENERKNLARNLEKQAKVVERLTDSEKNLSNRIVSAFQWIFTCLLVSDSNVLVRLILKERIMHFGRPSNCKRTEQIRCWLRLSNVLLKPLSRPSEQRTYVHLLRRITLDFNSVSRLFLHRCG